MPSSDCGLQLGLLFGNIPLPDAPIKNISTKTFGLNRRAVHCMVEISDLSTETRYFDIRISKLLNVEPEMRNYIIAAGGRAQKL